MLSYLKKPVFLLAFMSLTFLACQSDKVDTNSRLVEKQQPKPAGIPLLLKRNDIPVRKSPGINGEILRVLNKNTILYDQGRVSDFVTFMRLDNKDYQEPWIFIQTAEQIEGWVFACADFFETDNSIGINSSYFLYKRFHAIFGDKLYEELEQFTAYASGISSKEEWIKAFRAFQKLRNDIQIQLNEQYRKKQDYFWLAELIPGLIVFRKSGNPSIVLYIDYKTWGNLAGQTKSGLDDALVNVYYSMFATDSIEYEFPDWSIQTDEDKAHSLLGRNLHYNILFKLDVLKRETSLFNEEIVQIKKKIVTDIGGYATTFWEEKSLIIQELEKIKNQDFAVLNKEELQIIENILNEVKSGQYDIKLNYKSGLQDITNEN